MPAPYQTLPEIIESAHAQHIEPLTYILDLAHDYAWTEPETVAVLEALSRHTRHEATRPQPQPLADILALANEFAQSLEDDDDDPERIPALEHAVANYTSAAWRAAQTDDPSALESLEHWTGAIAEVIGLDPIPTTDPERQRLEGRPQARREDGTLNPHAIAGSLAAAIQVDHLTAEQVDELTAMLERAGY